ncbi:hypothetical protein EAF04_003447 [Stromatinia cepivora]|nr:hypothetical protein EAF04_003447 [Stromatinia cepivora]
MPQVKISHGSDNYYLFNGVFPEGQLTEQDQELSEMMARSLINFAYTGNPISESQPQKQFDDWPDSYDEVGNDDRLNNVKIQVIGGPHGTGSVILTDETDDQRIKRSEKIGNMQQVLSDADNFGSMGLARENERKRLIEQEKLFQRCAYINSLADTLDI